MESLFLRVANESGTPYSTLHKRLKQGLVSAPKMRIKPVFLEEKKQALTDHLERLSNMLLLFDAIKILILNYM
jgi:hypothetical protein